MAFPKSTNDSTGKDNRYGNVIPHDENSNKGPSTSTKTVGLIKGRITTSKSSIMDLNTGVPTCRDDDC